MSNNELGNTGVQRLAHGLLHKDCVLQKLDVSENGIDAVGAKAISSSLRTNTSLQELNMNLNSVGDDGATVIAEVLSENSTLKYLSLRRNNIGNDGATGFGKKLPQFLGLKDLILIRNMIDEAGASAILKGIEGNMEIEYLGLADVLSTPVLRDIVYWIRLNRAGRRIFRCDKAGHSLFPLVLSKNNDDNEVLFHFLQQKPDLFKESKRRKLSSCVWM